MRDEQELGEHELNAILNRVIRSKPPQEIIGQMGLAGDLTRRLMERVPDGERTAHLGCAEHSHEGRSGANLRKSVKTDTTENSARKVLCTWRS